MGNYIKALFTPYLEAIAVGGSDIRGKGNWLLNRQEIPRPKHKIINKIWGGGRGPVLLESRTVLFYTI